MAFLPFCFRDYSGLAVCPFSPKASFPAAGGGAQSIRPSIIEARSASRRETVKICHVRLRKKLNGTSERPRLAVFRSNKHLYAQVIDDTKGCTLASASSIHKSLREELEMSSGTTIEVAKRLGSEIAKACLAKGITKVAFDRGGFVYHGRIEALANAARENGLVF